MAGHEKIKTLFRVKKLRTVFIIYWILLAYIIVALVWWFIALYQQNEVIAKFKLAQISAAPDGAWQSSVAKVADERARDIRMYVLEGITFLLFIIGGAVFVVLLKACVFEWFQD